MTSEKELIITSKMVEDEKEVERECEEEQGKLRRKLKEESDSENREKHYKRFLQLLTCSNVYTSFMKEKMEANFKELRERQSCKSKGNAKPEDTSNAHSSNSSASMKEGSSIKEGNDDEDLASTRKRKRKPNPKYNITDIDEKNPKRVNKQERHKEDSKEAHATSEQNEGKRTTAFGITVSERQPALLEGGALRGYQLDSLDWLRVLYENGINGILADEMGLGKTIQAIAVICDLVEQGDSGPFIVIAPLSTLPNWFNEFQKFAPKMRVILFHGDKAEREKLRSSLQEQTMVEGKPVGPVVLTSYGLVIKETVLKKVKWSYMVVDEGHRLKKYNCVLGRILREYKTDNRLLLTGTPLQNDLSELWSLLNFVMPEVFHDLALFEKWFTVADLTQDDGNDKILKQEQKKNVLTIMHQILAPFLLRRVKADVQVQIPPKKEILVYSPMSPIQLELYRATVERNFSKLLKHDSEESLIIPDEPDGSRPKRRCSRKSSDAESSKEDVVVVVDKTDKDYKLILKMQNPMMQLRKIVNHPYLVHFPLLPGEKKLKVDEDLVNRSGKLRVLDAMLPKLKAQGHKVLIFSNFAMLLDILEEYLNMRGYTYERLDGSVSLVDRKTRIESFNTNPDIFVFIISTRAGGLGINLTAADTVVIYDSDWNPQVDLQAQDRCHRIGQTRPVVVYRFVTAGTIDEQIVERAAAKRKLEKMIIQKGKFKFYKNDQHELMNIQELMALLNSRDHQEVIHSNGYVFTDEELESLLDRSDMISSSVETVTKGKEMGNVYKVLNSAMSSPRAQSTSLSDLETRMQLLHVEVEDGCSSSDTMRGVVLPATSPTTPLPSTPGPSSLGKVKSVELGTPIIQSVSPYSKLPSADKWQQDICDVINFENLSHSTGRYESMSEILRKVRTTVTQIQQDDDAGK